MRKSNEQKLFERLVKLLPMLNDESLEALLRLVKQLQTAHRMGRSVMLNAQSPDGNVLSMGKPTPRPSAHTPQQLDSEDA